MTYKDQTFCTSKTCGYLECFRRYTPEVAKEADQWWGNIFKDDTPMSGPPIAVSDFTQTCSGYMEAVVKYDDKGYIHSSSGPAVEYTHGRPHLWMIHGNQYDFYEWCGRLRKSDKKRAVLLLTYG